MRKKMLRMFSMAMILIMVVASQGISAGAADYHREDQIMYVEKPDPADPNNASIIFSAAPQMNKMTFLDGQSYGRYDARYSEQVEWIGIQGRQVYVENYLYCTFDPGFADKEDSVFQFVIDYWDYGGGGDFHVEYTGKGQGEVIRVTLQKLGLDENNQKTEGGWHRVTFYIDDACFTGSLDYGTDFRLVSNAYNTFSRIEVRNLSKTAGAQEEFGVFNGKKAESLHYLQMFDGFGEGDTFEPQLERKFTREEFYVQMMKSYALGDDALNENRKSKFTDVSAEASPYIGYAEKIGVIKKDGTVLGASENIPQKEMVAAYLRLIGVSGNNLEENAITLGKQYGLINAGSMIFQPERDGNVDVFVTLAMNVFSISNLNTGESAFGKLFNEGFYNEDTLVNANDKALNNWMLENIFTITKREITDPNSLRTYYEIDFFGQNALKEYYTENCMSIDNRYLVFRDKNMHLYVYEIETNQTKYVGDVIRDYNFMITPKNNLWYTNSNWEIVKVSLDLDIKTDEFVQEVITRIPEWQTQKPYMLQVNNAETRVSYEWFDTRGDFDANYYSRIPIYKVDTDEWDMDHWWGFISDWYRPNHMCINPVYDNLAFFAHEGYHPNSTPQYDRVWAVNMDTDEYYNAIPQKAYRWDNDLLGDKYFTGENLVHEAWSNDGEWIMAVKNVGTLDGIARGVGQAGAVMVRPDGTDKKYIPVEYEFTRKHDGGDSGATICHCMLSNTSDRWLVGDSQYGRGFSDLYLIDTYTGKDYFLARLPLKDNPGHIHPQFSMDDTKVIFGQQSDDMSHVEIGWMDVSDIVFGTPLEGGKYDLSETCDTFGYNGFEHYIIADYGENGEIQGFRIPRNNQMNVNVKASLVESDSTSADITVTYLDQGTTPIKISYNTWDNDVGGFGKLTERERYIERKNTGRFVTTTVHFDDINLGNMFALGIDFRISGVSTEAYIKSVDVEVPEENKKPAVNKLTTPPTADERR